MTGPSAAPVRVVLIDDHAVVRTGYRRLLDDEAGLQVVGEFADADRKRLSIRVRLSRRFRCGDCGQVPSRVLLPFGIGRCDVQPVYEQQRSIGSMEARQWRGCGREPYASVCDSLGAAAALQFNDRLGRQLQ